MVNSITLNTKPLDNCEWVKKETLMLTGIVHIGGIITPEEILRNQPDYNIDGMTPFFNVAYVGNTQVSIHYPDITILDDYRLEILRAKSKHDIQMAKLIHNQIASPKKLYRVSNR